MSFAPSRTFNAIADGLSARERKALIELMWAGAGRLPGGIDDETVMIVPDRAAGEGELLFYVSFPGSVRDKIPTQHYVVGAMDEREAITRAHELYQQQPRIRKGASLRVMLGRPPGR